MTVATEKNTTTPYLAAFEQFEKERLRESQAWITPIRNKAIARFAELGFPTTAHEDWRFTSLRPLTERSFKPAPATPPALSLNALKPHLVDAPHRVVLVNGRFAPELSKLDSLPRGLKVGSLAEAIENEPDLVEPHLARYAEIEDYPFRALNTAFIEDGAWIHASRGVRVTEAIHVLLVSTATDEPFVAHPRNLLVLDEDSQLTVVEGYLGFGNGIYFNNAVTEIAVAENANLDHYKVQRESLGAFHIASQRLHQGRSSTITTHSLAIGGGLVRNNMHAFLDGEGCDCTLNGLFLGDGDQHIDNHLRVEHAMPHCNSWEYYKGILDGRASGVFTGRIKVHKDAQKTDAKQTNMNLLLSEDAQVDTKPQLEIFADDVKCTHGATIGQIDPDAIFYLRTRGVPEQTARSLLIYAFAGESLDQIRIEPLQEQMRQILMHRLPQSDVL